MDPETGGGDETPPPGPTTGDWTPGTTGTTEVTTSGTGTDTGEATVGSSGEDSTGPMPPPICGNGFVEGDEPCDDANDDPDDGCDKQCQRTGVPIWTVSWDSGAKQDDSANAVVVDADGNLYVAGTVENADNYADAVVRKLDAQGDELSQFVYAGQLGLDDGARAVALTDDGGVVMAGFETLVDQGPEQAFVRKFSAAGEVVWTYTQQSMYVDGYSSVGSVAVRGDAIFVLGSEEVEDDIYEDYLHRLDPDDGQPMWTVNLDMGTFSARGLAIEPGGDVLLTTTRALGMDDGPVPVVARHAAADGAEVWTRSYDDEVGYARAIAVADDGSIAVAGFFLNDLGDWDAWTTRLDADGATVWSDEYDADGADDRGMAIAWSSGGDVYVGGFVYRGAEQSNAWVRRYTGDGVTYWSSEYNDPVDLYDEVLGVAVTDAQVVVVGSENVLGAGRNQWLRAYAP